MYPTERLDVAHRSSQACVCCTVRRVSFARGPLPDTVDGHPPHEGVQSAARAAGAPPPALLESGLTPAHVRSLEV